MTMLGLYIIRRHYLSYMASLEGSVRVL